MAGALNSLLIGCLLQGALCQFEINIPQSIKVLSGSCVTIPCSFEIEGQYVEYLNNKCKVIWKNIEGAIVFDSAEQTRLKWELRGTLTEKDCTTTLNNVVLGDRNEYHLRLECQNVLKYDFRGRFVNIFVKDDPPTPTLSPSTLRVREGASVSLKCSAPAPCLSHPPTLTWTPRLGDSQETLQENQDKTKVKTSVLTFTASHHHHAREIACTAVYNKQDGSSESSVRTSLTPDISFAPQILPSSHCTKTVGQLNCSCETVGNPFPTLEWYLNGSLISHSDSSAISSEHLNETGLRGFITMNQPQERNLSTLLCRSSNYLGSAIRQYFVSGPEPPPFPESQECSGQVEKSVFITTVSVLTAALVCSLLFAIRAQRTYCFHPAKSQCTGDASTAVMSRGLTREKDNKVSITSEEDIYVNMMRKPDEHHQQDVSKSSEKKHEEGSDVIYSSVIWKSRSKKKRGEYSSNWNPSGSSYLEEERCMEGCRNYVSNAVELGSLYGNVVTGKYK